MRFWDSSALVPLFLEEPHSGACRNILKDDPELVVWFFTRTEVTSAIYRKMQLQQIDRDDAARSLGRLTLFVSRWSEVGIFEDTREVAERMLKIHSLRTGDALQLAAAIIAFDRRPKNRGFVCLDENLCNAADLEGFDVVRPEKGKKKANS